MIKTQAERRPGFLALYSWLESQLTAEQFRWALWAPVFMAWGSISWLALPFIWQWQTLAGLCLLCIAAGLTIGWHSPLGRAMMLAAILFAAGFGNVWLHATIHGAPVIERDYRYSRLIGQIEDMIWRADGRVHLVLRNGKIEDRTTGPALKRIRLLLRPWSMKDLKAPLVPGCTIRVTASISPPQGPSAPGGYDFARLSWFKGVGATAYTRSPVTIVSCKKGGIMERIRTVSRRLTVMIHTIVGGPEGTVAAAMVTGDMGSVPRKITTDMRHSGLSHLLSISGVHIAIVTAIAFWFCRKLLLLIPWLALRIPVKVLAAAGAAVAAISYTLISGVQWPTVRSCLAALFVLAAIALSRQPSGCRLIASAAMAMLIVLPDSILSVSFQMSFTAITTLVAVQESEMAQRYFKTHPGSGWPYRLRAGLVNIMVTGLAIEMALTPIVVYHFNKTGFYGSMANLIGIPLTSFIIMPLLVISLALTPLGLGEPFWYLSGRSIALLNELAAQTAALPGAVIRLPNIEPVAMTTIMLGMAWLLLWTRPWRMAGVGVMAVGLGLSLIQPKPDMLISRDGKLIALSLADGSLVFSSMTRGRFTRKVWTEDRGGPGTYGFRDVPAEALLRHCTDAGCRLVVQSNDTIWHITHVVRWLGRDPLKKLCLTSDIVISSYRISDLCTPKVALYDRSFLNSHGASTLYLDGKIARIKTSRHPASGHPW